MYLEAWRHAFQEDLKAYAEHVLKLSLADIKAMLRLSIRANNGKEIQLREVVEIDLGRASP
ncbi:MAG: hypothetical protein PHC94_05735 [Methylobacter sp.]|nr:hypothetical protein [Methylococcales bacterium]MDD5113498.1 hypothetical protein [Methylobacter sp.]